MTVLLEALFLAAMMVAAIFAGSEAWSKESIGVESQAATALMIVIRPAVNLDVAPDESGESGNSAAVRELTLAEIVDTATIPVAQRENVLRHLRTVVLTDLPAFGEERTFTQEGLEAIVGEATRRLESAGFSVEWKVPARSHILRKSNFSREAVSKSLRQEFSSRCGGCEVVLRKIEMPKVQGLKIHTWRLVVRADRPRGNFAVPIEIDLLSDSEDLSKTSRKTLMVTGDVELYANVPVATRAISGSEKITATDFKIDRRNVTFALDTAALSQEILASVAAKGLAFGEPIWKSSLRREQLIRFGDPVRVQVGGESWSITSDGVAQGSAALGDSVRVKVGKSQKLVSGVLKEKGLVEIE